MIPLVLLSGFLQKNIFSDLLLRYIPQEGARSVTALEIPFFIFFFRLP